MKVKEKKIDDLNRELTIEVAAADYAEIEKKKLADRRRTAEFKGFRKGMVPASLIKRVYGEQALVESVNQVIGQALDIVHPYFLLYYLFLFASGNASGNARTTLILQIY